MILSNACSSNSLLIDSCSNGAIKGIESLVLSFLTQLSLSLIPSPNVNEDDIDEADMSTLKKAKARKIELKLADRKKIISDGYATFYFIYTFHSKVFSGLWVHALYATHGKQSLWVSVHPHMLLN